MDAFYLFFLCFCGTCTTVFGATMKDATNPWHVIIDMGQTASLPCAVESNFLTDPNQFEWTKIDSGGSEFKISTGSVIVEPFSSTKRFSIERRVDVDGFTKVAAMALTIQGITAADNGTYRCDVVTSTGATLSVTRVLNIPVVLQKFLFTSETEYRKNRSRLTFVFEENVPQYVICHVTSLNHRPTLRILKGQENVTSQFVSVVNSTTRGPPGLQEIVWDAYLLKPDFVLKESDRGKMLRCMAWFKKPFPKGTARRAALKVVFKPKFICKKEHFVNPARSGYSLSCIIHSYPQVDIQSITWTYKESPSFAIAIGQRQGDFSSYISVDPLQNANDVTVILSIRNVSQYVPKTYQLRASNDVGLSTIDITLNIATETASSTVAMSTPSTKETKGSSIQESFEPLQSKDRERIMQVTSSASLCTGPGHLLACTTAAVLLILCHDTFLHS